MTESSSATSSAKTCVAALDELFLAVNRSDAPGMVVGVALRGKTIYRRGFGLASVELGVVNTAWTRMRIGSTSKHFTCLALLLLAEEGRVDPDASVRLHIPELPSFGHEPTLRQLMTHTGGYRCYLDLGFLADGLAIRSKGAALAAQVRQTGENFAPGESILYCNGGYHLLSQVIARVSGMPFEQFLKERIFTPLGMIDTVSAPSDLELHSGMATLHVPRPDGGWRRGLLPSEDVLGEGAMISTLDDMLRWLSHMRGVKTIGSDASWAQMMTLSRLNDGTVNPYALGLMRHDYRGVEMIHHPGGVVGGASQMLTVPSHELEIIIMSNGALASPVDLANRVVDMMLGEALGPTAEKARTERFGPLIGNRYHSPDTGLVIGFGDADGRLGLAFLNNPAMPLTDDGETLGIAFQEIALGPLTLPLAPLEDLQEPPASLQFSEAGNISTFRLLPSPAPITAEAATALVGHYRAPDLGADAEIRFDGEVLNLHIHGAHAMTVMTLEAFSADLFGLASADPALPTRGVLSVKRAEGRVTRFILHTLRTRNLRFERVHPPAQPPGNTECGSPTRR